jgi:hypothetical protein
MRKASVLLLVLAACGTSDKRETDVKDKPVHPDIPAYLGLEYVEGKGKGNQGFRSSKQVYRGDAKVEDVLNFYRKTLPQHGWKSEPESGTDAVTLTFVKENERCTVTVGTDSYNKTVVTVVVSYKG